ncbi:hypothetical protein AAG906_016726 [Vitis piasezkii]
MIVGAQQGMGIEPSPYEIKHKYLDMEYKDMEAYVNIQREKWKTYGCTIMSFFLNPRFQYKRGVGTDPDLLQAVHEVFAKLDPTSEAEWWFMYGHHAPTLRRPLHLDDEDGNPDPRIAAHVREAGVDVDRPAVTSRPSFDSTSVEHSSRPSATGTSASGYDGSRGEGTNDGSDPGNDEGDVRQQQQSGQPWAFTCEDDFTHCTQDEDHGSRRAGPGVGAIGKPYRGRQRRMMPYNEDSLLAALSR